MDNYSSLIERIARSASVDLSEVERRIEAKRAKLSGLISKEGAAQIVAAELGITFDNELMRIAELVEGMKRAHVIGKITQVFPVRSYSKNGREGKIGSFLLGDASSNVRVVLWDVHHIDMIENGTLKEGSIIEILNGGVRSGELHLGAFSTLKESNEKLDEVKTSRSSSSGTIADAKEGAYVKVRGFIVQVFDPKVFDDKRNPGTKRALVNFVMDDGTETIRALMNDRILPNLGLSEEEIFSPELFGAKKEALLGEEKLFTGTFKMNTYFNRLEFNVENVQDIDPALIIKELEAR